MTGCALRLVALAVTLVSLGAGAAPGRAATVEEFRGPDRATRVWLLEGKAWAAVPGEGLFCQRDGEFVLDLAEPEDAAITVSEDGRFALFTHGEKEVLSRIERLDLLAPGQPTAVPIPEGALAFTALVAPATGQVLAVTATRPPIGQPQGAELLFLWPSQRSYPVAAVNRLSWSADGTALLLCGSQAGLRVFRPASGEQIEFPGHFGRVASSASGQWLAAAEIGGTGAVRLIRGDTVQQTLAVGAPVTGLALAPGGGELAVATTTEILRARAENRWTLEPLGLELKEARPLALALSEDGVLAVLLGRADSGARRTIVQAIRLLDREGRTLLDQPLTGWEEIPALPALRFAAGDGAFYLSAGPRLLRIVPGDEQKGGAAQ